MIDANNLTEYQQIFLYWIKERESIRVSKEAGQPKPWTDDPILQSYRFCNVEREKDTVSVWIHKNWCEPYRDHPNLWFAMIVARLFNWPPTLEIIGVPICSKGEGFDFWKTNAHEMLKLHRDKRGEKIFTGAYLVSTNGVSMDKIDYILDRVLTPIWERGRAPRMKGEDVSKFDNYPVTEKPVFADTLESYWKFLTQFDGLGSFMAGQVVADLKYTPMLERASDWWTWAPLGPGSIRGLNRFYGRPMGKPLRQEQGLKELQEQQKLIEEKLGWKLPVHNVQNCNCEFDKYLRVKNGEGRPRSTYPGR